MLSLHLFGGFQARLGEEPLSGRAAHRKRLALLAVLATAPTRTVSRDKLAALLWPDQDYERGRHQLATAVYDLRKAGGEELILASGDDLRLSPASIACDVWEFEEALSAGERERAVQRYAGPLLDGFFLLDAGELERWIESERDRLARRYAQALEELAAGSEARNDFAAAAQWWRLLAAQDPYSPRVALRLMQALARGGELAAAIQHASIHATLLREDLEAGPNPEILAFAERLRTGASSQRKTTVQTEETTPPVRREPEPTSADLSRNEGVPVVAAVNTVEDRSRRDTIPVGPSVRRRRGIWAAGALGIGVLLLSGILALLPVVGRASSSAEQVLVQTLAVLPLKNDTGDPAQEHFADAMTEALIAALARGSDLRVISRTSVMPYKSPGSRTLPEIARELSADLIVEGSVFRDGEQVRITVQLISASTDAHVWAETYEGSIEGIFALQDRVAQAVAEQIGVRLAVHAEKSRGSVPLPVNLGAYEAYLEARRSGGAKSLEALQRAIALDPEFTPAYATLADRLALAGFFGSLPPDSAFEGARRAAQQALARDAGSAEAHGALGIVLLHYDWNWAEAERHFRRALALNPSHAYLRHMFAHQLLAQGRTEESAQETARAAELDPFNAGMMACSGWHGLAAGQSKHAATESLRALRMQPDSFWPEMILGWAYEQEKRYPEAIAAFQDAVLHSGGASFALAAQAHAHAVAGEEQKARDILVELHQRSRTGYVSAYDIAAVYAGLRESDEALRWLERAYQERSSFLINVGWEPRFRGLHSDVRFQRLVRRVGVPIREEHG